MNLWSALTRTALKNPAKTALFWGDTELGYHDLWGRSQAVARLLITQYSVRPGDRVGLWLKNCPEFVPAFFGTVAAGGVVVPINNFLKPPEVAFILQDAGIQVLITDSELAASAEILKQACPALKLIEVAGSAPFREKADLRRDGMGALPGDDVPESELAVLIYTSGTTGRPKGAMLSHGNLLHNVESCRLVLETVETDRFAVLLPLFHSYMLTVGMLLPLLVGGSMIVVRSLHPPRSALQELLEKQATILPAIPQFYRSIVSSTALTHLPLRMCISGAAPLPAQILHEFEQKFKIPLIEGYGLSEASPVVTKNPLNGLRKAGSIGKAIPHVEVSIQDDQGKVLNPGEIGELCVRGGNVMLGYWQKPEETRKVMRDGWLLTGDMGYCDQEGYFFITDRKKDMLLVNGINVYPREIEEILYEHVAVREAAVIGKPDPRRGEQPVAFVSFNEGQQADPFELQAFIRERLADYKVPRQVVVLPNLPRNATGKILKTALRDLPLSTNHTTSSLLTK